YYNCYKNVVLIKRELKKLSLTEQKKEESVLLLTQQVEEIFGAKLIPNEDIIIKSRLNGEKNRAKILSALQSAYDGINNSDVNNCIVDTSNSISNQLESISDFYESAGDFVTKIEGLAAEFSEIATDISVIISDFSANENSPQAIELMQERLDLINKLRRKYGNTIEEIIEFGNKAQIELDELTFSDKKIVELSEKGNAEFKRLISIAQKLTEKRKLAGEKFSKLIKAELEFLDMTNVDFITEILQIKPNINGEDAVQFLISTNVGEPPKPISKIASGGELSRIMLAIKNIMVDRIQTLIFDEIDTGVSGHAAQKIGLKLSQVSKNIQVIAVTHSAQIAALADHHFLISKKSDKDSTFTTISKLDKTGRIGEVARIMSTDKITDLMLENAKEMIER
ncbi:MAG: DNA repair protein RecN, partial [Oscillospiraceae bacterium]